MVLVEVDKKLENKKKRKLAATHDPYTVLAPRPKKRTNQSYRTVKTWWFCKSGTKEGEVIKSQEKGCCTR